MKFCLLFSYFVCGFCRVGAVCAIRVEFILDDICWKEFDWGKVGELIATLSRKKTYNGVLASHKWF